ncbi:MAG: class B sortase [Oscillospiraceae bacterium]|nr:class B sortase [Oscillospiraceae bacterium]
MSAATKIGKKTIRLMNSLVDTAVMIVILLLVAVGCYAIWDSEQVFQTAKAVRYEIYKPTAENKGKTFAELRAVNPDVFGWLTVYGTHIDYPVVQGAGNMQYINTNAEGQYSLSGAIFLDSNCNPDFSDFSSLIYGHHMEKQAMFGEIGNFSDKSYFDSRKYGMIYYDGQEHGLEFFAFVHADAYDNAVFRTKIESLEERQAYIDMIFSRAFHARDIQVTAGDHIVLLSTCSASSTNGRDILVGRITDEVYGDTFKTDKIENSANKILTVDGIPKIWAQAPLWVKIVIIGLPFLLVIFLTIKFVKNKKRSKK